MWMFRYVCVGMYSKRFTAKIQTKLSVTNWSCSVCKLPHSVCSGSRTLGEESHLQTTVASWVRHFTGVTVVCLSLLLRVILPQTGAQCQSMAFLRLFLGSDSPTLFNALLSVHSSAPTGFTVFFPHLVSVFAPVGFLYECCIQDKPLLIISKMNFPDHDWLFF